MTENSAPTYDHIEVTCDGRRATLTLARPDSLNSLTNDVMAEIIDAANWFDHQPDLRVVVVSGEGRAFCSGFNVTAFTDITSGTTTTTTDAVTAVDTDRTGW